MNDAQRAAFRATRYCFNSPDGELSLTVDMPSSALSSLLHGHRAESMAVLTAFNPQGQRRDPSANLDAQEQLRHELGTGGFAFLPGRNEDPAGEWVEESFLVFGISLAEARNLAVRHEQLAFLWTDAASATPRLIETAARD
jgi:hypothetical protein